jgi:type VI secretion system protein ImpA
MPLRDDLLTPIPGTNPAGVYLQYDAVYDQIKEARREEDDVPQGDWQRARKVADWALVTKLASDALGTKTKDLQITAWLAESLVRREGFRGLRDSLAFVRALLEQFWEHLYPPIEDGDLEPRQSALEWLNRLDVPVKTVPLNRRGHNFFKYWESRAVGYEADAEGNSVKQEARQNAIAEGKLTAEEFDQGVDETPKSWYKELMADIEGCQESLRLLDAVGEERFGTEAPSYSQLRGALDEVQHVVRQLLNKKLKADPDPLEVQPVVEPSSRAASANEVQGTAPFEHDVHADGASLVLSPRPVSQSAAASDYEDAAARVAEAARFLRRADPRNPASYLLLRGFRWGELRSRGSTPDPKLLEAPSTQVRTHLKHLLLDAAWPQLLEGAETVMATPQGRGWLDLQRYTLTACEGMGSDFYAVAFAIRGQLRALLSDLPQLVEMTLMDDTPTANPETQTWLRETIMTDGGSRPASFDMTYDPRWERDDGRERRSGDAWERALAEVRSGRPERGIELLMREAVREKSRRGRFLRQTQLAGIMVDAGLESVAVPILQELLAQIEAHKLEEWEAGDVVAQPLALLYRCLEKLEGDAGVKQDLYLRLCRLDPLRAIGLAQR